MISEEALRQAAAEASDCLVRSLDEAGIPVHNFSARFERKMRRLIRRTRHPAAYRALVRVACAFLAFLLGSGVFLAVNPEARAAFFGWVRTQYEHCSCMTWRIRRTDRIAGIYLGMASGGV